jgi:2-keto-4-pentenoate hydratase/2-oxohepta-3-ene-1,7-dioic acid hydratase in catechol pathway
MRLVTFSSDGSPRLGALLDADQRILDLQSAHELLHSRTADAFASMQSLIEAGPAALETARDMLDAEPGAALTSIRSARLLAPLPVPIQMRDFMLFEQHATNSGKRKVPEVWYQQPVYYKCNRFAVQGTEAEVRWPAYSNVIDFELELAMIVGKKGVDIPKHKAREHIFGYTIFNDFSARDAQFREMTCYLGPAKGKDFDGANCLGPCIVTADEIDPYALTMIARVNGEEWTRGRSDTMHHTFEDVIAHVSQSETIYPGEIMASGTVGRGCGDELGRFLAKSDVVELEIEHIGVLRHRVI